MIKTLKSGFCKRRGEYMKSTSMRKKIKELTIKRYKNDSERSPYWDDASLRGRVNGDMQEHPCANPDVLPETNDAAPSTPQLLMGEAVEHLQGRQRECYILTMREGKSFSEAAEILGIGKGRVQQYRERAIKFITHWCEQQIAKGRV
jgi:DNA-directed RNA polymerase specialized sigma24 family protein